MNIDDLKKILAVVETGSINRAAEKLYTVQPAISRSIRRIEEEYNIVLFQRAQGKKAELTEEGQMFCNAAKEIMLVNENLERQLERHRRRNENTIRFGIPPQQSVFLFGEMLQWFYKNGQDYQLETHSASSRQLHRMLTDNELDTALISVAEKYDELHYEKEQKLYANLYLSPNSPLMEKRRYSEKLGMYIIDVHDMELDTITVNRKGSASRDIFDRLVEKYNLKVRIIEEDSSMYKRLKMADEGIASYFLSAAGSETVKTDRGRGSAGRYVLIDPEQDIESWRYIVCRNGFEKTEKYRILRKCLTSIMK